ncbi:MAG: hypothetical protein KDK71_09920, partial [Chlamydiia bacterium]|nr:hypothetical protein [Chlamydiia bacterium]
RFMITVISSFLQSPPPIDEVSNGRFDVVHGAQENKVSTLAWGAFAAAVICPPLGILITVIEGVILLAQYFSSKNASKRLTIDDDKSIPVYTRPATQVVETEVTTTCIDALEKSLVQEHQISFQVGSDNECFKNQDYKSADDISDERDLTTLIKHDIENIPANSKVNYRGQEYPAIKEMPERLRMGVKPFHFYRDNGIEIGKNQDETLATMNAILVWSGMKPDEAFKTPSISNPVFVLQSLIRHYLPSALILPEEQNKLINEAVNEAYDQGVHNLIEQKQEDIHIYLQPRDGENLSVQVKSKITLNLPGGKKKTIDILTHYTITPGKDGEGAQVVVQRVGNPAS